uniref:RelA/SpoT domain-containing protein n=1 Tax=Gibberella zeae TaxID=5518 RepID=A0A4E9DR71_GIBZA
MHSFNSPKLTYPHLIEERSLAFQNVERGGSPVEAFLDAWPRLEPHYKSMVEILKMALQHELKVRCTIAARVKSLSSITKSIQRREYHRGQRYREVDEIFDDLHDLAGFRIVVDYPSGIASAKAFITKNFQLKSTTLFNADREVDGVWKPTFGSFKSENHHVLLHPDAGDPLSSFCGIVFEIQVLSLAEGLYNRLAHPLLYKKSSGQLSVKDQKIIDVTHGLSLCYWICLSCMEDRLEGKESEEIPSPIQEVARLDGNENADMLSLVKATPYSMPPSRGDIPLERCLDSIKDLSTQTMSSDQLHDRLSLVLNNPTQTFTTNVNSGSGGIMQNYGSGSNNTYNAGGNITIGKEDIDDEIRDAFWVVDPQSHKADIEERQGGLIKRSYRWILQHGHFKQWYKEDYPLLWLNGDPGKGKTMCMCGIINHINLQSKRENNGLSPILSYFFCDASYPTFNNATSVLRGIIGSIIFQDSMALSYVRKRFKEFSKPLLDPRIAWPVLKKILVGILGANKAKKTYLIIDALDECRDDRDKLLDLIANQPYMPHVKWLVSSRKWSDIKEALRRCPRLLGLSLEDNEVAVSTAVDLYITHKVEDLCTMKEYDKNERVAVESHLRSKANNTFLWVSLVCQMLIRTPADLTMMMLESFPSGLDALYRRMLEQIQPSSEHGIDPSFGKLYGKIVSFALSAFRPLSLDELCYLIDDDKITVRRFQGIIDLCGSFLTVQHRTIHFIHESAKEYLLGEKSGFNFHPQHYHFLLFAQSIRNLSRSLHRDMLDQESNQPRQARDALSSFSYQCIHWISHLSECEPSARTQQLMEGGPVDKFLRQKFLFWVETLGHLNSISLGISEMLKLYRILHDHSSHVKDLVQDELRYIRYNRFGIEQCPLQVYPLLNLSPIHCMTRKIYGSQAPDAFALQHGVNDDWSPCILAMEGHNGIVESVVFSHDGSLLASGSSDSKVMIWDVLTGTCLHTLSGHESHVVALAFSNKNYELASGYQDRTIKIWDANNGILLRSFNSHGDRVCSLAYSNSGRVLALGSSGSIKLFDTPSGVCTKTIKITNSRYGRRYGSTDSVDSIVFTHDDQILSCGISDTVIIWDLRIQAHPYEIQRKKDLFVSRSLVSSQANEIYFLSASGDPDTSPHIHQIRDYQVEIWNPDTKVHIRSIKYPVFDPYTRLFQMDSVIFPGDGTLHAVIQSNKVGFLNHSVPEWKQQVRGGSLTGSISPTRDVLAATTHSTIKLWDLLSIPYWDHSSQSIHRSPNFSNDGSLIAVGLEEEGETKMIIWRSCTGDYLSRFTPHRDEFILNFSPDGQMMVLRFPHEIYVGQTSEADIMNRFPSPFPNDEITLTFSHDSRWLAIMPVRGSSIRIWDMAAKPIKTSCAKLRYGSAERRKGLSFSHNCKTLAVYDGKYVKLYETKTWLCKLTIRNAARVAPGFHKVIFSFDDKWLATISEYIFQDKTELSIWNMKTMTIVTRVLYPRYWFTVLGLDVSRSFRLETDLGTFQIVNNSIQQVASLKYAISDDLQWILQGTKRLLWLPPDFRPLGKYNIEFKFCKACFKFKVAITTSINSLVFLTLP